MQTQLANKTLSFPARGSRLTYTVSTTKLFTHFRLLANGSTTNVRLADFELYGVAIAEADDQSVLVPTDVTATAEGLSGTEQIARVADGSRTTNYRANFVEPVSITYIYADTVRINAYSLTASKNEPTRDPAAWTLEGSNDGNTWTPIDSRSGETFSNRYATQFYSAEPAEAYSNYRLTVNAVNGGDQIQLGELQLLSFQPVDPTGINDIKDLNDLKNLNDLKVYNLAGQRLGKVQRGVNIVNGRKVLY